MTFKFSALALLMWALGTLSAPAQVNLKLIGSSRPDYLRGAIQKITAAGILWMVDVSDPARPVLVWNELTGWAASGIDAAGENLYIAAGEEGLLVFEISERIAFTPIAQADGNLYLFWAGAPGRKLQRTRSRTHPVWVDVPGSEGARWIILPVEQGSGFFRLITP